MRTIKFLSFLFTCLLSSSLSAQTNEPTIATCDGNQSICIDAALFELCVVIDPSGFNQPIDHYEIKWDDGTTKIVQVTDPLIQYHPYDLTDFFCTEEYSLEKTVKLTTYPVSGPSVSTATFPTFFNPPKAFFSTSSPICVGEAIQLNNNSYPTEGLTSCLWDYGDSQTGASNSHVYAEAGVYTVQLKVFNMCDTATASQQVEVLQLPVADPVATAGVSQYLPDTLVVCLGDTVCLNGDSLSLNENYWKWAFSPSLGNNCFDWIVDPPQPSLLMSLLQRPKLVFYCDGIVTLELTVNNPCNEPDTKKLIFKVVRPPVIEFDLNVSDCTPTITLNPADYLDIDGELTSCHWDFDAAGTSNLCDPGDITFAQSTTVTFTGINECANIVLTGNVTFTQSGQAVINSTCPDTLCSDDAPCKFWANIPDGTWSFNNATIDTLVFDPGSVNPGLHTITYGAPPCILPHSVNVFVIDGGVELDGQQEVCLDGGAVTYTATPPGGVFSSSNGAIDSVTGMYDPALAGPGPDEIFYQTDNNSFCQGNASLPIEVVELAVGFEVTSCDELTICFGTTPATSNYSSILWNFGDSQTSTQASPCHTYSSASTYVVTVTIMAGTCTASYSESITIVEPPFADFDLSYPSPACGPLSVAMTNLSTGGDLVYEWNIGGVIVNGQDPGPIVLNNTATISLTVSNNCGNSTHSETVVVEPSPVAAFGANLFVCSGDTLKIFNVSMLYDSLYWDFGNGQTSTDTSTVQEMVYFTGNENDFVTITLIAFGTCNPDTFQLQIVVVPTDAEANVTTTAAPLFQICQNEEVCFESFSLPSGIPLLWDFGDNNTAIGFNVCHAWSQPGVYHVVGKLVACGFDSTVITITVLPIPKADFVLPSNRCPGEDLPFQNLSMDATGYKWYFGDGDSSILVSPTHAYEMEGFYEVCLVVLSANGCRDSVCHTLEISAPPMASFTVANPGCQGDDVLFTSTSSPDVVSCSWDFDDGNISGNCFVFHQFALPDTYNVTLTVTNGEGCTASASQNVLVGEVPLPGFTFDLLDDCHPGTVAFNNTSQLADGYLWEFGDGDTSTLSNPQHTYLQHGTFTITLTAIADGVCMLSFSQELTIHETPVPVISLAQNDLCFGEVFQFQNASTGSISNVTWDFGDDVFSFEPNPEHTYTEASTFQVVLTAFNGNFCQSSDTLEVTVHPPVLATALVHDVSCFGDATGSIDINISSGTAPLQFDWSSGATGEDVPDLPAGNYTLFITDSNDCKWDSTITVQQPAALALSILSEQIVTCAGGSDAGICVEASGGVLGYSITWENGLAGGCIANISAGEYAVSLTDANNCLLATSFEVHENPPIEITDSMRHRPCFGEDVAFIRIDKVQGGAGGYSISLEGADGYFQMGNNFGKLLPGPYSLTVTDMLGCFIEKNYIITEPDSIWLNVVDDTISLKLGADTILFIEHNLGLPMFNWSSPESLDCMDCPEPVARPFNDTQYRLTTTDANGCTLSDRVFVKVEKDRTVYIPNIFTPNGDGRNDVFRVRAGVESIEEVSLFQITDRWGEVVFEAKGFDPVVELLADAWNGTFRGKELPPDVYYYIAHIKYVDGEELLFEGSVTLVR